MEDLQIWTENTRTCWYSSFWKLSSVWNEYTYDCLALNMKKKRLEMNKWFNNLVQEFARKGDNVVRLWFAHQLTVFPINGKAVKVGELLHFCPANSISLFLKGAQLITVVPSLTLLGVSIDNGGCVEWSLWTVISLVTQSPE